MTYEALIGFIHSMTNRRRELRDNIHFLVVLPEYLFYSLQESIMKEIDKTSLVIQQDGETFKLPSAGFTTLRLPIGVTVDLTIGDHIYIKQLN